MQRDFDEERRSYESRNEKARKQVVNQADNDRSDHVTKMEGERAHLEGVIDGLKE